MNRVTDQNSSGTEAGQNRQTQDRGQDQLAEGGHRSSLLLREAKPPPYGLLEIADVIRQPHRPGATAPVADANRTRRIRQANQTR